MYNLYVCLQIDDHCDNTTPCLEHRQKLLNLSMGKLQMSTLRREPCLRRSVLIFNTLRRIEGDPLLINTDSNLLTADQQNPIEDDEPHLDNSHHHPHHHMDNNNYLEEDDDIIMTDISRTVHLQTANHYSSFFDLDSSNNQQNTWLDIAANTMLDLESTSALLTPLSADELLNALPNVSSSSVECGKSVTSTYCSGIGATGCDDLDHIMQVIVGN